MIGKQSDQNNEDKDNFDEYIFAFLRIDKSSKLIRNLRFSNIEPFKPSSLAKIEKFEIDAWYAPVINKGPMIAMETALEVSGTYGFFYQFFEGVEQRVDNIRHHIDNDKRQR